MIFLLLSKWERPLSLYALSQSEADGVSCCCRKFWVVVWVLSKDFYWLHRPQLKLSILTPFAKKISPKLVAPVWKPQTQIFSYKYAKELQNETPKCKDV